MSRIPDLVIAHGTVVNSFGRRHAHVVVRDGRIEQLIDAAEPVPAAGRTIDATGRLVVPGGVDGHCHVAQVTGRFRTLDDYRTTSTAALWGGTTTIIDFGIPRDAQETPLAAVLHKKELALDPAATSPCTAPSSAGTRPCPGSWSSWQPRECVR